MAWHPFGARASAITVMTMPGRRTHMRSAKINQIPCESPFIMTSGTRPPFFLPKAKQFHRPGATPFIRVVNIQKKSNFLHRRFNELNCRPAAAITITITTTTSSHHTLSITFTTTIFITPVCWICTGSGHWPPGGTTWATLGRPWVQLAVYSLCNPLTSTTNSFLRCES